MADIELVIKIPEEMYDWLENGFTDEDDAEKLWQIVKSGMPLPKGHGRLMDYGYVVDAIDDWVNAGEYNYTNATDYLRNRIRNVPTIIEADKPTYGCSSCPHSGSIIDGYVDCPDAYTKQSQYCGLNNKEG